MTCDVLLLAQTFVASLVSSVFFLLPPKSVLSISWKPKKGGFGSMILPSGRCKDQKGWTKILDMREGNHHFWLDIVRRKLKPPPNGVWIDRPKICRVTISLPQKSPDHGYCWARLWGLLVVQEGHVLKIRKTLFFELVVEGWCRTFSKMLLLQLVVNACKLCYYFLSIM